MDIVTKYGVLKGVQRVEQYSTGELHSCTLTEKVEIDTAYGTLIPIYEETTQRSKYYKSLSFYPSGNLKSISLHQQTKINTTIGTQEVELVTFYESGKLNRIFQLNGKLSGFWEEEEEFALAKPISIPLKWGNSTVKASGIRFYESGALKNIVLWKNERISIPCQGKLLQARLGCSFYENGDIESMEPFVPYEVDTPIGKIRAFNNHPIGIHADSSSLQFDKTGKVKAVTTITDRVVILADNVRVVFEPTYIPSFVNPEEKELVPISLKFFENEVFLYNYDRKQHRYELSKAEFIIEKVDFKANSPCSSCETCKGCS